ncbi:MAG: hypothetical protein RL213_564 [Bacteroidota bacterium]
MSKILLEVACANLQSVRAAVEGGADRIELCAALGAGGLTPSDGFIREALRISTVPVFVMIRPREGDFLYSEDEFKIMLQDLARCRELGVTGVVTGMLTAAGQVDKSQVARFLGSSGDMQVTFHRAFDLSRDAAESLRDLMESGVHRLLTSGMASSAPEGAECIRQLVLQSAGRLVVMAGAGVNPGNAADLVRKSGVSEVHLSGKMMQASAMTFRRAALSMGAPDADEYTLAVTDSRIIRSVREALDGI